MPQTIGEEEYSAIDTWGPGRRLLHNLLFVPIAAASSVIAAGLLGMFTSLSATRQWAGGILIGVLFAMACALVFRGRLKATSTAQAPSFNAIEKLQKKRREQLWTFVLTSPLSLPLFQTEAHRAWDHTSSFVDVFEWIAAVGMLLLTVCAIMTLLGFGYARSFRFAMNDELSLVHQAQAIRTGFLALMAGCVASFVAGLVQPHWFLLLPTFVIGAVDIAAVHFIILDRQAEASD